MYVWSIQERNPRMFRQTLGHFASGVTVITTMHEGIVHGMTANAFCSVSLEPPLVLICVGNRSHMHRLLAQSEHYGVSILARSQEALSRHFAGWSQEGLQVPFVWHEGCPLIEGAVAQLTWSGKGNGVAAIPSPKNRTRKFLYIRLKPLVAPV